MKNVQISIVMPVYQAEKYLKQTIESLLQQEFKEFELICVDDGSTDRSLEIIEQYRKLDERIIIISKKHTNAGEARNAGLKKACGKYVLFLDADDFFFQDMLDKAYGQAEKTHADIVVFGAKEYSEETHREKFNSYFLRTDILPGTDCFSLRQNPDILTTFTPVAPWNKFLRREFVLQNSLQFESIPSANDLSFITLALLLADRITVVDEVLMCYRIGNAQSLQGSTKKSPYDGIHALLAVYDELCKRGLYENYKKAFNDRCMDTILYLIRRISQQEIFIEFFDSLKNEYLQRLGLKKANKKDFYNEEYYTEKQNIEKSTAVEYLLSRCKMLEKKANKKCWLFPYEKIRSGSRIVLYGAGEVGKSYYSQIKTNHYCTINLWVDKIPGEYQGENIQEKEILKDYREFDYIVIALSNKYAKEEISNELISIGIKKDTII